MKGVVSILTVHYQTLDFLERLLESARQYIGMSDVIVVDGSTDKEFVEGVQDLAKTYPNMKACELGYNIGHGLGIVHGLEHVETPYVFVMDSDDYFIKDGLFTELLELMRDDVYGVGRVYSLNRKDCAPSKGLPGYIPMRYMHPSGMLINMSRVHDFVLPLDHGAPMIKTMQDIQDKGVAHTVLVDFRSIYSYMCRPKGGTTARWPKLKNEVMRSKTARLGDCKMVAA